MGRPRISIERFMLVVALVAVPIALFANTTNGHAFTGANVLADMGLWPGLVAFGAASYFLATRRSTRSPFLWGFAATGWAALLSYVALCLETDLINFAMLFYWNDLGDWGFAWLTDFESYEGYALNMIVMGLMLATPQLVVATVGGLIARRIWGTRWTST